MKDGRILTLALSLHIIILVAQQILTVDNESRACNGVLTPQTKEGKKMEIQKFEYLENEKNILDEIKKIFHSF